MQHIKLHLKNEIIEGILVKEDEKHYTVKLDNGYNLGISKNRVERKELSSQELMMEHTKVKHVQDSSLSKILILHTGGTIASKVDYKTGAVTAKFEPAELIQLFPELKELAHIESRLISNMMSDDMRFVHYNILAKEVAKELESKNYKGIIITHGTDTMHYTSAALSFIFEHLPVPVVLVGSQRSSDRGSSDSAINLISAVSFIVNTSLAGVFICMHEDESDNSCIILNGLNVRKMHSSRRDAFHPINTRPIARINYFTKEIEYLSEYPSSQLNNPGMLKLHPFNESLKIGFIISHPNMYHEELLAYKDFDGLILEGTGLGHMPITEMDEHTKEHNKIKDAIAELCKKMPVIMTTQTISGTVNMNVYSPGRELQEIGVIGNQSTLCPETAFIKLAWLISQKLDPKTYFSKNLRGELG
jgi:glutamyl-tRNA(Gln) amidotransferase subunit D